MQGRIIKQISNQYTIAIKDKIFTCNARGKFKNMGLSPLVGDMVDINTDTRTIEKILPRKNELYRPTVANVDCALIVTSIKKPDLSLSLLDKLITIILAKNVKPIIVLTKLDLIDNQAKRKLKPIINYYKSLDIPVLTNKNIFKLKRLLKNQVVVLTGQTGAGKSTLINKFDKSLNIETRPISNALNRGVHTTRHTEIYKIGHIYLVDTPGFSALDLKDISISDLKNTFKEFNNYSCAYKDCTHDAEKGCGVKIALENGKILQTRYQNYLRFLKEVYESSSKLYK